MIPKPRSPSASLLIVFLAATPFAVAGEHSVLPREPVAIGTAPQFVLDTGASRRVARTSSEELWTLWQNEPQNILIPDELDHESYNFF